MKPALRKQLFERWKELAVQVKEPQSFDYFLTHINEGLIHVQIDSVEALFAYPPNKLSYVCQNIVALSQLLIPPQE